MTAVIVTDALARHFKERVTGTKEAYATGAGGQSAPVLPADIYDTPIVLCMWRHVDVVPGSFERTTWTINADAYFSGADPAAAYQKYVQYVDDVRSSIRGNWTLFGTCTQISGWSGGDPEDVSVNGKAYVRVPFEFRILEGGIADLRGVKITITTTGLDGLQLKLDRYHGPLLAKSLGKATIAAARTLVKPMRAAAPRRTGALAKSVKATRARKGDKPGAIVGPRVWYRHFPIGGTRRGVRANPFVTRTAEANSATTERKFRDVLHDELSRR